MPRYAVTFTVYVDADDEDDAVENADTWVRLGEADATAVEEVA